MPSLRNCYLNTQQREIIKVFSPPSNPVWSAGALRAHMTCLKLHRTLCKSENTTSQSLTASFTHLDIFCLKGLPLQYQNKYYGNSLMQCKKIPSCEQLLAWKFNIWLKCWASLGYLKEHPAITNCKRTDLNFISHPCIWFLFQIYLKGYLSLSSPFPTLNHTENTSQQISSPKHTQMFCKIQASWPTGINSIKCQKDTKTYQTHHLSLKQGNCFYFRSPTFPYFARHRLQLYASLQHWYL